MIKLTPGSLASWATDRACPGEQSKTINIVNVGIEDLKHLSCFWGLCSGQNFLFLVDFNRIKCLPLCICATNPPSKQGVSKACSKPTPLNVILRWVNLILFFFFLIGQPHSWSIQPSHNNQGSRSVTWTQVTQQHGGLERRREREKVGRGFLFFS